MLKVTMSFFGRKIKKIAIFGTENANEIRLASKLLSGLVSTEYRRVTDRETDGQTDILR